MQSGNISSIAGVNPPLIPDHTLLRPIGRGAYGEVWLARNVMGALRAVKIIQRAQFESDRPYEREFAGIKRFEPISRSHDSQVDIFHVGRNDAGGYFYYVMELADDATNGAESGPVRDPQRYTPETLKTVLAKRRRLLVSECLPIGLALADATELERHVDARETVRLRRGARAWRRPSM